MSGLEVIGAIATVLTIIDSCVKACESAGKDLKLPEAFNVAARRLPVLANTLQTCKTHLESRKSLMPSDVCNALEKTLDSCEQKSGNLRTIFEKVIVQQGDGRMTRYKKVASRLGKGNAVEELMKAITEDVQHVVNHDAVQSASPDQSQKLESILRELQVLEPSLGVDDGSSIRTQNNNTGSGPQIVNENMSGTQNISWVVQPKDDFSYVAPTGMCLDQAPYIDQNSFIGREAEQDLIADFLRPKGKFLEQRRLVLGGMGGMGKTQLAIAYAKRHSEAYDSIFWLNATSEASLQISFAAMAERVFDMKDHRSLSSEQTVIQVRRWLSDQRNTRWLLIFDNYDDPSAYDIQKYYPYATHGAIIITTRLADHISGQSLHLQPLDNIDHGLRILEIRSQRSNIGAGEWSYRISDNLLMSSSDTYARKLADRLKGLPLALATAGVYLRKSTWTFQQYLDEYEKKWNVSSRRSLRLSEYQDRTLYTTWNLSYHRLEQEDAEAAQMLKLLAYFDHQAIGKELLQAGIHGGAHDSAPEWLVGVVSDSSELDNMMRVLIDYCFLELQTTTGRYTIHTCVHDWLLASLNKSVEPWSYWYAFDCVGNSIDENDWESLAYLRYAPLAAHTARLTHSRFDDVGKEIDLNRLFRAGRLAQLLRDQNRLAASIVLLSRALSGYEKTLGIDHPWTLDVVNNLALLYYNQGKLDTAEQMCLRALHEYEKASGSDEIRYIQTFDNLGLVYIDQGRLDDAERTYLRVVARFEDVLGPDHRDTLRAIHNLGFLYFEQRKLEMAEQTYKRALLGREQALGNTHVLTLETIDSLGELYRIQGELDIAEETCRRALTGREEALGPNHLSTLESVHNLGRIYVDQGRLDEAERLYSRAKIGGEEVVGSYHPSVLSCKHDLATLHRIRGQLDEAESMYQKLLAEYETVVGDDQPPTMMLVNDIGLLYEDESRYDDAEYMYRRALAAYEKRSGPKHWKTREVAQNLARICSRKPQTAEVNR